MPGLLGDYPFIRALKRPLTASQFRPLAPLPAPDFPTADDFVPEPDSE